MKKGTHSYRRWDPQTVLAQIDTLVNRYGVRNLKFADEIFVLDPRHVLGICDGIIERGYGLNIWAYARVDTIKGRGMLQKLKRAGVSWLALGIEAANEKVRKDVQKKFDQELVYKTVKAVHSEGIHIIGNYIFGLPDDTLETMQETLDLALELNCEFANFYCAMAYPGSQLYRLAIQEGWPLPKAWQDYSPYAHETQPLPTKYLSGTEVLRFRDRAFRVYFSSPKYLDMVERKFDPETAHHIREMASHNLVRKHI